MSFETCPFCEHSNPEDSKFCNACGGALHLMPCPRCGAVSDVTAITCYQCNGPLPEHGKNVLDVPDSAAEAPTPLPQSRASAIVGTAIFAAIALIGYFSFDEAIHVGDRASPEGSGAAAANATAGDLTPAVTVQPAIPLAGAAPAAVIQPRESRQPVESRAPGTAAPPAARAKGTNEVSASDRNQSRPIVCAEAVAALGLCMLKPARKTGAEAAATSKPVIARSKASPQGARRQEACTEGAAALGLCTPRLLQEGK